MRAPACSSDATSRHTAQRAVVVLHLARGRRRHERDSRRSARADGRSSRRLRGRGSRTPARTRSRAAPGAPRCVRPTGRRPCAPARPAGSRATAPCSGENSTTSQAPTAGTDTPLGDRSPRRPPRDRGEVDRRARRQRGPTVGEPADVVRIGRLQAADAEGAAVARQVRTRLAVPDDVDPVAGERVEPHLPANRGAGVVIGVARHVAILAASTEALAYPQRSSTNGLIVWSHVRQRGICAQRTRVTVSRRRRSFWNRVPGLAARRTTRIRPRRHLDRGRGRRCPARPRCLDELGAVSAHDHSRERPADGSQRLAPLPKGLVPKKNAPVAGTSPSTPFGGSRSLLPLAIAAPSHTDTYDRAVDFGGFVDVDGCEDTTRKC